VSTHCKIRISKSENGHKQKTIAILITTNNNIDRIMQELFGDWTSCCDNTIQYDRGDYAFNNIIIYSIIYISPRISPKHSKNTT